MATVSHSARRVLLAAGLAVAAPAVPIVMSLTAGHGPDSPALASCPSTEVFDPTTGGCKPLTDPAADGVSVIPGVSELSPGAITQSGQLPEVNGVPCNGQNTGLCLGMLENNPSGPKSQS